MEFREFLNLLSRKKGVLVLFVMIFLAAAMVFVLVTPLKYEATTRVLVKQDLAEDTNSYTVMESNNSVSRLLARVIDSSAFFKKVIDSDHNIKTQYFSPTGDSREMAQKWKETVQAHALGEGGGIMDISVYHTEKVQARQVIEGVNNTLKTEHSRYHDLGDRVNIKVIDYPIVSAFPAKPNIFYIFSLALILGAVTGMSYIYLFHAPAGEKRQQSRREDDILAAEREQGRFIPAGEDVYSFYQKQNYSYIPIKQEDERDFLTEERSEQEPRPEESPSEPEPAEEESEEEKEEENEAVSRRSPAPPEKDPREIEEKGDMRNILE